MAGQGNLRAPKRFILLNMSANYTVIIAEAAIEDFASQLVNPRTCYLLSFQHMISLILHLCFLAVATIVVSTCFASILFPMLVALFYFSTPHSRKAPVFISAVVTLTLGAFQGFWTVGVAVCPV
jgi:hypothetical protein